MTVSTFRAVAVLAACLIITGSMGLMAYRYLRMEYRQNTEADIRLQMQSLQEDMQLELGRISSSLAFLVDQVESHSRLPEVESKNTLSHDFLSFVKASRNYDQVRLIDMEGREVIRANFNNGSPALVANSGLQDKTDRYYVREGLKLKRDEVYLSPFDLNIENGRIELPIKPTIRLVQPAFDAKDRQIGLVVINVLGNQLLEHITIQSRAVPAESVSLLNEEGYWLAGPNKADLWAFMYPGHQDSSLAKRAPEVWKQIRNADQARVKADQGVYLSGSFYPARVFSKTGLHVSRAGERVWKLVAYYSDASVAAALTDQRRLIIFGSIAAGVALATILLGMLRRLAQAKLRQAAEARAREQAVEHERAKAIVTITGGVAHEFNNILASILGSADLLRDSLAGQPELTDNIDIIDRQGERGAQLVRHLMTFAQIDYSQDKLLLLNELVAERVDVWRQSLPAQINLQVEIAETPLHLRASKDKLEAALQHLFDNAADAVANTRTPQIRLSLAAVRKGPEPNDREKQRYACLVLQDNGCGIAAAALPYIFDPFFTTKEPGEGPGLGLALVSGVVRSLQGDIKVESSPGEGTTVRIYLPIENGGNSHSPANQSALSG